MKTFFKFIIFILMLGCASNSENKLQTDFVSSDFQSKNSNDVNKQFDIFLKAYTSGNVLECAEFIDQTMIGRQELVESLTKSKTNQKQISFYKNNFKMELLADNTAVLNISWEKYFLNLTGSEEKRIGKTIFFLQKHANNEWKLVGQTGDNIFLP
jgi:hypothetical protein